MSTEAAVAGGVAGMSGAAPEPGGPVIRILRGDPDAEELAALVVALSALSSARAAAPQDEPRSSWTDRARLLTPTWAAGPRGWRGSASRR